MCGPPTLIPREIEALGCEVAPTLDELGEADVVYVLRMQNERMSDAYVPSLREYAARYQVNAARLRPRQLLMHPGPVNRGVELSADAIDSPQALIGEQVEAGRGGADGGPLRAAGRDGERRSTRPPWSRRSRPHERAPAVPRAPRRRRSC